MVYGSETSVVTSRLWKQLLAVFFPQVCLSCQRLAENDSFDLGLCDTCRSQLRPLGDGGCSACGRPLEAVPLPDGFLCGDCRRRTPAIDRFVAGWSFEPPFDRVIHGLKYGRLDFLGTQLARGLWSRLGHQLEEAEVVVPVPLHWRRRLSRGYNQAEEIARPLARLLDRPLERAMRRVRATPPQTRFDRRHRAANVAGAFRVRGRSRLSGRRVLIVDDVATTGSTLETAAACLKAAGAVWTVALVAGWTPMSTTQAETPTDKGLFDRVSGDTL
ncbi:MAG: ComF family protein [Thermoanaerobaculia bacterium]